MLTFGPGDRVHVAGVGTGVVREARQGGRYVIEIKGSTMIVSAGQMERAGAERGPRRPAQEAPLSFTPRPAAAAASAALDLDGRTVEEAIEALDVFLNEAILDGRDEVHIIHGRSGGKLKAAVHARLRQLPTVRAFRLDPGNPGATVARL